MKISDAKKALRMMMGGSQSLADESRIERYAKKMEEFKEENRTRQKNMTQAEKEQLTIEMELANIESAFKNLRTRGVARRIIFGSILNSFDYSELNELGSEIDSFLRSLTYKQ